MSAWKRGSIDLSLRVLPSSGCRQPDLERGALPHFRLKVDEAAMAFDNAQRGGKPKAGPFPKIFCGEERVKNLFSHFRRNASTRVNDFDNNVGAELAFGIHIRAVGFDWYIFGGYPQLASARHGVASIDAEIKQYLVNLGRIAQNRAQVLGKVRFDTDGFRKCFASDVHYFGDKMLRLH